MKGVYFIAVFLFVSCIDKSKEIRKKESNLNADSSSLSKILNLIANLSFVKESAHLIDSITDHKHGMTFILDNLKDSQIYIKAGFNSELRFETFYQFYINPQTNSVKLYEPVNDSLIDITRLIKNNN